MRTIGTAQDSPAGINLLADHLDTALAVGEDLLALNLAPRADLDLVDADGAPDALDHFARRALQLELSLIMRVVQASRRAGEIKGGDSALRAVMALLTAQTEGLLDIVAANTDNAAGVVGIGGECYSYLRSRGLLAPEAAAPSPYESLVVTEGFLVGGSVRLGGLLDMVSGVLDHLDVRFGLYAPEDDLASGEVVMPGLGLDASSDADPAIGPEDHRVAAPDTPEARNQPVVSAQAEEVPAAATNPPVMPASDAAMAAALALARSGAEEMNRGSKSAQAKEGAPQALAAVTAPIPAPIRERGAKSSTAPPGAAAGAQHRSLISALQSAATPR